MTSQRRRPSSANSISSRASASLQSDGELKLECRAVFLSRYDDIKDNIESKDELITLLQQTGRNASSKVISKYWSPNTEDMTFDDFVDICRKEPVTTEEDLMKAFRKIDLNGDGYISLDELFKILTTKGEKMSKEEVREMIDEVDENKDGKLDYREFSKMVVSSTEDFKKMSIKVMEKKEKRNAKQREEDKSPRKGFNQDRRGSRQSISSTLANEHAMERRGSRQSLSARVASDEHSIERRGSRQSLSTRVTSDDHSMERRGSRQSLSTRVASDEHSMERRGSRQSLSTRVASDEDLTKPSPRSRKDVKQTSPGKLMPPGNLKDWNVVQSKGTFFLDEGGDIISHVYSLSLPEDSDMWITMQHLKIGESGESLDGTVTDTALLVLKKDGVSLVAFTENKDSKGKYSLRCSLHAGTYILIPFTTGCRLKLRKDMPTKESKLISKDADGNISLTRAFRKGLEEIFTLTDLDGNGLLSRSEFNWYNLRTSGEEVGDDEWQVVEDNIELENGEITLNGFIRLNEMEADDNDGDTDDAWVTMTSMGFNKSLILDEACPFLLKIYSHDCADTKLRVIGLQSCKDRIDTAICEFVTSKCEPMKVKNMKDLALYQYVNDHRGIIVVDNKSKLKIKIQLDCRRSKNVVSHTGSLLSTVTALPQSSVVGHYLLPLDDSKEFRVECEESILT
ncbi:hypothetical protein BsWGS_02823 [Bradybaena similaris]